MHIEKYTEECTHSIHWGLEAAVFTIESSPKHQL